MTAERISTDVVVIGSGAAGAAVAMRCAERGVRVVVLEEGGRFLPARDADGDLRGVLTKHYRHAGAMTSLGRPAIPLQVGCCVGGSTVVNGGTCFRTPTAVLEEWSAMLGRAFLPTDLEPYFVEVERDLHVEEVPETLAYLGERLLLKAARARGDQADWVKRPVIACQGTGLCAFGCPTGAKQSMENTYVPRAENRGAKVFPRTRATQILMRGNRAVGVAARSVANRRPDALEVRAESVVLAAGTLHSPILLQRSLKRQTPVQTARNLRLHPGSHVFGIFPKSLGPKTGPMQSVAISRPGERYIIFGMGYPPEVLGAMLVEGGSQIGKIAAYQNTVGVAVMASDHHGQGRVVGLSGGVPLPLYFLGSEDGEVLVRGIVHAAELFFEAGAREVHHGIRGLPAFKNATEARAIAGKEMPPEIFVLGSVHPMGTCRMGLDPRSSVVDPLHRVHGITGLYIPDASFFPTPIGVNPQITVNAFALRCADLMGKDL